MSSMPSTCSFPNVTLDRLIDSQQQCIRCHLLIIRTLNDRVGSNPAKRMHTFYPMESSLEKRKRNWKERFADDDESLHSLPNSQKLSSDCSHTPPPKKKKREETAEKEMHTSGVAYNCKIISMFKENVLSF